MCKFSELNQKNSSLSENLEKAVNNMKVQNRKVNVLLESIKILQNELFQKNEIIKSLMGIQSTEFVSLLAARDNPIISDRHHQ